MSLPLVIRLGGALVVLAIFQISTRADSAPSYDTFSAPRSTLVSRRIGGEGGYLAAQSFQTSSSGDLNLRSIGIRFENREAGYRVFARIVADMKGYPVGEELALWSNPVSLGDFDWFSGTVIPVPSSRYWIVFGTDRPPARSMDEVGTKPVIVAPVGVTNGAWFMKGGACAFWNPDSNRGPAFARDWDLYTNASLAIQLSSGAHEAKFARDNSAKLWNRVYTIGWWLLFSGVVLEGPEAALGLYRVLRRLWRNPKGKSSPLNAPIPSWLHTVSHIGWLILVTGLGLEQCGHTKLSQISDKEIASLTTQLQRSTKEAGEAQERAARLQLAADGIRARAAKFEGDVEKLKDAARPRTITLGQAWAFTNGFFGKPQGQVRIGVANPDRETINLEEQVVELLINAGFSVTEKVTYPFPFPFEGDKQIGIGVHSRATAPPGAFWLFDRFQSMKLSPVLFTNGPSPGPMDTAPEQILLLIGTKPPPAF